MNARASRTRMISARILVGLFVILAFVGLLGGYIRYQALDNDTVRHTAEQLIGNEDVRDQIAASLVDQLYANVDVDSRLAERLPTDQKGLSGVLATALRELSDRAARELLARPRAQALWVESISRTHEQLLKVLDDDVRGFTTEDGVVVLDLRPLVLQLGDQVAIFGRVAEALPQDAGRVEIMEADQLETAQDITQLLKVLGPIAWLLALLAAAGALWLAAGRRRSILRSLAVALVGIGLLVLVLLRVFGEKVVDTLAKSEGVRPAVEQTWLIVTGLLGDGAWTVIGVGLVALVGVWLTGASRPATRARRGPRPAPRPAGAGLRRRRALPAADRLVGADGPDPAVGFPAPGGDPALRRDRGAAADDGARARGRPGGRRAAGDEAGLDGLTSPARLTRSG